MIEGIFNNPAKTETVHIASAVSEMAKNSEFRSRGLEGEINTTKLGKLAIYFQAKLNTL